jgi:sterol desaturase/sphingolipid hydroxylase (fatty acid hydroxylase superfamily)
MTSSFLSLDWESMVHAVLGRLAEGHGLILLLLFGTIALAASITFVQSRGVARSAGGFWHHFLPPGTVQHPSVRADFLFWLSKRLLMPPLVLMLGISTVTAGQAAYAVLRLFLGSPSYPTQPAGFWTLCAFTLTMMVVYDFSNYSFHRLQHRIPVLWEIHKVHHSAQLLVGVTKDRVHPVDEILSRWWSGLLTGTTYAIWLYFVLDPIELTIFGINAYALTNTVIMMDFVRHTHLKLSYGKWLNAIFLCPHYHQLHHSIEPRHYDRNFGQILAIWDWLFGTLAVPRAGEDFVFGLADGEHDQYQSLLRLYAIPFRKVAQRLWNGEVTLRPTGGHVAKEQILTPERML